MSYMVTAKLGPAYVTEVNNIHISGKQNMWSQRLIISLQVIDAPNQETKK